MSKDSFKQKKASAPDKSQIRAFLSQAELDSCRDYLEDQLLKRLPSWGAHGWAFEGSKNRQRLVVFVERTFLEPERPVGLLELPSSYHGIQLKPSVRSVGPLSDHSLTPEQRKIQRRRIRRGPSSQVWSDPCIPQPVAPGSRIFVDESKMHGGISCILRIDQKLILVTAGHLFPKDAAKGAVISVFDGSRYEPVATLMRNFLEDTEPLDAAVCALTDEGLRYLRQSTGAVTFRCAGVALPEKWTPSSSWQPIFFPTQPDGARPLTVRLESASSGVLAQESCVFDDDVEWRVALRGLIRTNGLTDSADSGSVLIVKSGEQFGLLGLCSGGVPGRFSLFTPIATVIRRLKAAWPQKEINLWTGSGK